jgi:peptidoglycan/LPS O-acetylase OafA/YrhL
MTAGAAIQPARHIPVLDGVRALAILLVIPHNVDVLTGPVTSFEYPAVVLMHTGWIGVQLFFVLSGFLITANLLDTRGATNYFSAFFARRTLRIMPLYFATLLIMLGVAPLVLHALEPLRATASKQIWLWTFLCNWTQPYEGSVYGFGHFWSLAVEEQFYLLWPLIVWRCRPQRLLRLCVGIAIGAVLVRAALAAKQFPHEALYMFTPCRMDALALGAAGAAMLRIPSTAEWLRRRAHSIAIGSVAILIGVAAGTHGFAVYDLSSQLVGYTLIAVAFAAFITLASLQPAGSMGALLTPLRSTPMRLIGRYSYGMYVFHLPLHVFVGLPLLQRLAPQISPTVAFAYSAIMLLASFALAALSYELFERHFLRLKKRLAYKITPTSMALRSEPE